MVPYKDVSAVIISLEDYMASKEYKDVVSYAKRISYGDTDRANDFIADCLVIPWHNICATWDKTKCDCFKKWCFIKFRWNALRELTRVKRRIECGSDIHAITMKEVDLAYDDDSKASLEFIAVDKGNATEHVDVYELLQKIPPDLSFIVWNHAKGFTLEQIANELGISKVTVHERYRGAIAMLSRISGR